MAASAALVLAARSAPAADLDRRLGVLVFGDEHSTRRSYDFFREGLASRGLEDGRSITLITRHADFSRDRAVLAARELVDAGATLLVTQAQAGYAALPYAGRIPVVFSFSGDPVEAGFTTSMSRPDKGMSGVSFMSLDLVGKRLEVLRELRPSARRVAVVANPTHAGERAEFTASSVAAAALGIELSHHPLRSPEELDRVLGEVLASGAEAIDAFPDALVSRLAPRLAEFSRLHRMAIISGWAAFAEDGNVVSFGPRLSTCHRRVGYFVDRLLRGARTSELPIEQPTEVELVVNMRTATALGIAVPAALLHRADEVIE